MHVAFLWGYPTWSAYLQSLDDFWYSDCAMFNPLLISMIIRTVCIVLGLSGMIYELFRAIEWVNNAHNPSGVEHVKKKLQRTTVLLAIYIALLSAIVLVEKIPFNPDHPICLGFTCEWQTSQ